MTYFVKEIFYTLQGEGMNAGRPAVFLRFSGCNLWTGREEDRAKGPGGCSAWCDTDFVGTGGVGGGRFEFAEMLARAAAETWEPDGTGDRFIVCTGGEPLLQLDTLLIEALHRERFEIAVETNGTQLIPAGIDWVCVSPKAGVDLKVRSGNELKLVVPQEGIEPSQFELLAFEHFLVQPKDGPDVAESTRLAVRFCLTHPRWRLSLQTHKYLGIA